MEKVVCPACGLVNLEKFVTYPHCAACGELLSGAAPSRLAVWKRPISAILWATGLGLCCAALGVAGILTARETQHSDERRLVVYIQMPRRITMGRVTKLQLGFDDLDVAVGSGAIFDELQLRLPRDLQQNFELIEVSPTPLNRIQRHNGLYFDFGSLTRDQNLFISLRPLRGGTHEVAFTLYARDFLPYQWNSRVGVDANSPALRAKPATPPIATPPIATPPIATPPIATTPIATPPIATPPIATTRQTGP